MNNIYIIHLRSLCIITINTMAPDISVAKKKFDRINFTEWFELYFFFFLLNHSHSKMKQKIVFCFN